MRDDDQEHQRRVGGAGEPQPAARRELRDRDADDQRVAEVEARHGRDRVVEAAEQVGAEVQARVRADGVREAEVGEARRRGGVQDVADERERRADDQRRAQERKRVRAPAVHPDEHTGRAREMQGDVEEAEQRGHARKQACEVLDVLLDEEVEAALERDDVCGVRSGGRPVLAAESAHELVRAVEDGERCELDATGVGPVGEATDAVEEHDATLASRRGRNHAAGQRL